jgi:hypothetical protein
MCSIVLKTPPEGLIPVVVCTGEGNPWWEEKPLCPPIVPTIRYDFLISPSTGEPILITTPWLVFESELPNPYPIPRADVTKLESLLLQQEYWNRLNNVGKQHYVNRLNDLAKQHYSNRLNDLPKYKFVYVNMPFIHKAISFTKLTSSFGAGHAFDNVLFVKLMQPMIIDQDYAALLLERYTTAINVHQPTNKYTFTLTFINNEYINVKYMRKLSVVLTDLHTEGKNFIGPMTRFQAACKNDPQMEHTIKFFQIGLNTIGSSIMEKAMTYEQKIRRFQSLAHIVFDLLEKSKTLDDFYGSKEVNTKLTDFINLYTTILNANRLEFNNDRVYLHATLQLIDTAIPKNYFKDLKHFEEVLFKISNQHINIMYTNKLQ